MAYGSYGYGSWGSRHDPPGLKDIPEEMQDRYKKNYQMHKSDILTKDVMDGYSSWAPTYEEEMTPDVYTGPDIIANAVKKYLPNPRGLVIMDMACGTGLVGQKLYDMGYKIMDGNEPSEGMRMVRANKENDFYRCMYFYFLEDVKATDMPAGEYNAVVCSGGFGQNHIPPVAIPELLRITRKEGYLIFVIREEYLERAENYKDKKLENEFDRLAKEGFWRLVSRTVEPKYSFNKNGVLFVYKKLKDGPFPPKDRWW